PPPIMLMFTPSLVYLLLSHLHFISFFFFFTTPATPEIYTLSLHDALPIYAIASPAKSHQMLLPGDERLGRNGARRRWRRQLDRRSEEHTSELQSPDHLVCRLLLEKKKKNK